MPIRFNLPRRKPTSGPYHDHRPGYRGSFQCSEIGILAREPPRTGYLYPSYASLSEAATIPGGSNDRSVRPVSGDEQTNEVASRQTPARTKNSRADQGITPEPLAGPIADQVPVKRHDRPEILGAVALEVEPANLSVGDEATARNWPRREAYLIPVAAGPADLTTADPAEPAEPYTTSLLPSPSAVGQQSKPATPNPPAAAPSAAPSAGPPPPPLGPTTPSAGSPPPPLGPAASSPPTTDLTPATPRTPAPSLPATSPAAAPEAEPVPVAAPGPEPAPTALETTPPVTAVPTRAPASEPPGLEAAAAQAPAPAACSQAGPALVQPTPSPQASACSACRPVKPTKKSCWLLTWIHSWHRQVPQPKCQLPPATFPTTYQTCVPGPRPTSQMVTGPIHPAPQAARASAPSQCGCNPKAAKTPCFSWFHYGMASDFFAKVRSWRHGCACHCHDSEFRLWWGNCKRCATKCGPTATLASPQAIANPPLTQGQSALSSWSPVPGERPESRQVLERIALQGLNETP